MGPTTTNATRMAQNLYDIEEALQYIHGSHSMKFGVQIEHAGYNPTQQPASSNGAFTWSTLQDFLLDSRLNSFAAGAPGSDPSRSYVQYVYGTYFQDDWKMRPNFTWNLGLRYEPFTSPSEKHGRMSMLKDWVHDTAFDTHIGFFKSPSKKNFSPRVGFAWDPSGNGKTAVRGGFGLFFVDLLGAYFLGPAKNPPFAGSTASVLGNLASAPADMARIGPGLLSPVVTPVLFVDIINWNLNSSYEMKYNFTVERQLPGNFSVSAGYLGNRGFTCGG